MPSASPPPCPTTAQNFMKKPLKVWENSCKNPPQNQEIFQICWEILQKAPQMGSRRILGTAFGLLGGGFWVTLASKGPQDEKRDENWHGGPSLRGPSWDSKSSLFRKKRYQTWKNGFPDRLWKKGYILRGQNLKNDWPYSTFTCFLCGPGLPKRTPNRRENGPGLHRGLEKVIFGRFQKKHEQKEGKKSRG